MKIDSTTKALIILITYKAVDKIVEKQWVSFSLQALPSLKLFKQ